MKRFVFFCFFLVHIWSVVAQDGIPLASFENIPDSAQLRKGIASLWLLGDPSFVEQLKMAEYTDGTGKRFMVESRRIQDILEVQISPYDTTFYYATTEDTSTQKSPVSSLEVPPTTGTQNAPPYTEPNNTTSDITGDKTAEEANTATQLTQTVAPIDSVRTVPQGTWILRRNAESGKPISITIYLRESSDLFIVLRPSEIERFKDKSVIDFCLFQAYVRRDIPISFSFESLYYTSLNELKAKTAQQLPWYIFDPPQQYSTVEATSKALAKRLDTLVYLEDGAFDENGKPCYIETGMPQTKEEILNAASAADIAVGTKIKGGVNCAGFVKWIIDGIIKPIAGSGTYINSLKRPTDIPETDFNAAYLEKRDLFFGLDWIRNLAAARLSLTMKKTVYPQSAGIDVTVEPFSFSLPVRSHGFTQKKFAGYFKSVGYQVEYLQALLYYLAITEPGHFYLASVSGETGTPSLRQHSHVVAIFPYFDMLGTFKVDIYENAQATPLEDFIQKNKDAFIALVRVKSPEVGRFSP